MSQYSSQILVLSVSRCFFLSESVSRRVLQSVILSLWLLSVCPGSSSVSQSVNKSVFGGFISPSFLLLSFGWSILRLHNFVFFQYLAGQTDSLLVCFDQAAGAGRCHQNHVACVIQSTAHKRSLCANGMDQQCRIAVAT